ncbi:MAG: sialate O-acetylesterase [Verrucomicrobiaceae bacterium]|nr:MAG: sialate O-acetylesterase [Verrucomicrobiaceae bacterium]
MNLASLKKSSLLFPALAVLIASSAGIALADVQLPSIISDHMVLKKGSKIPIWGKAEPGEAVKVTLGDASAKATADSSGKWIASLDLSESKAGPFTLNIAGKNQIAVNDVLVGEVWLASGQSNMAFMLSAAIDAEKEIANSANPQIRQFRVDRAEAAEPADNCKGAWAVAGPETTPTFSAVAYFFAKRLQKELGKPVGIINSSVGGTPCEAWTSPQAIDTVPHLKEARETALNALKSAEPPADAKQAAKKKNGRPHSEPSCLFNGMINPVIPYALSGAIWYQGEANATRSWQYRTAFPLMITDWRTQWKQGDFPFYFCQLANFDKNKLPELADSPWAELREAQTLALKLPNTGQAVLIDLGEKGDIHPRNKQPAGDRLAIIALANQYGRKIPFSGPVFQSKKVEGDKIRLKFSHTDGGLVAKPLPATINVATKSGKTEPLVRRSPNSELEGFAIRGDDKTWVWADAKIDGDSVVVWSDKVPKPVDVRYAWADYPVCNLYNKADLPACPFRTDEDPAVTRDALY